MPFCGTLDTDNCWVLLAELIRWHELEEAYALQFSVNVGAPAKAMMLAIDSLFIKQRIRPCPVNMHRITSNEFEIREVQF